MRKISVFIAVMAAVIIMSPAAFGISYKFYAEPVTGINLESVRELFVRAMDKQSGDTYIEGDVKAQYELGVLFVEMYSATQFDGSVDYDEAKNYGKLFNLNQAAYWLRKAAYRDYAPAQYLLYNIGRWADVDSVPYMWLDKSVELGYARAQAQKADLELHKVDSMIHKGEDSTEALKQVIRLAEKSAEQGDAFGMFVLSRIYKNNRYPVYEESKSAEWEKKARKAAKNDPTIDFDDDDEEDLPKIREKKKK